MADKLVITSENEAFLTRITELSGETVTLCDQCGTCFEMCRFDAVNENIESENLKLSWFKRY